MSKKKSHETKETVEKETIEKEPQETAEASTTDKPSAEQTMEQMKDEINQLNDKYLRLNAEFQNYRKRVEKEKTDIFKYGSEKLFVEMLPIMDNFERAINAAEQDGSSGKIIEGVIMIKKSLDEFFEKNGVKKIEALNQPFDPIKHHAVMTVESDTDEKDIVIEVFQHGYVLNDKVIRPCMVKVSH